MAISAVLTFKSDGDALKIYDAVVDEMGVRGNPAPGAVYHWCAAIPGGLRVCDVWETPDDFNRFAQEKIGPITAKHGLGTPKVEITPVHESIEGTATSPRGVGVFVECDGESAELLAKVDEANKRMNVNENPPDGLIFHWTTATTSGIRAIDHWRSREDFDRFAGSTLSPTLKALGMPPPRIEFFEIHNALDPRVSAAV